MTQKEDNATTLSLLLPIRKGMIGGTQEPQEASVPVTINREGSAGEETISPAPDPGGMERTMKGKESKENRKTRRKIGKEKFPGNLLKRGLNFRSD